MASKLTVYSNSGSLHKQDEDEDEDEKATHTHITPNNTHEVSENDQMHIVNILEDLLCGNRISREDDHYNGHTVIHEKIVRNDNKSLKNGYEKMKFWSSTITSEHFLTILETLKGHKKVNSICCSLFFYFQFSNFLLSMLYVLFFFWSLSFSPVTLSFSFVFLILFCPSSSFFLFRLFEYLFVRTLLKSFHFLLLNIP
jgi:hypothetical protein